MTAPWTPQSLADAAAGTWLTDPAPFGVTGFSTDSRTIEPGNVFIALSGDSFDAHDFLDQIVDRGAAAAIVSEPRAASIPLLKVDDTLTALQQLATHHRNTLHTHGTKVIAVTGSNGKTTTRHLIHAVLAAKLRGTQSPKSFNNHIGLPLTLLAASPDDDFVVAEIGTNHPGEIDALAAIARPDVAVITNIGVAHIGMFGSRDAIGREKGALLARAEPDGLIVIPADEPLLDESVEPLLPDVQLNCIGVDVQCTEIQSTSLHDPTRFWVTANGEHLDVELPLPGEHNIANALCAIAVGQWFGLAGDAIAAALANVPGMPMRAQILQRGGITFINDAYNANPDSMRCALSMLANTDTAPRRVAVLGDMFELGDAAEDAHRQLGQLIAQFGDRIDLTVLVGKLSALAAESLPADRTSLFHELDPSRIRALLQPGDLVLVKASRGMALERLIPDA